MNQFSYHYGAESEQYSFFRIPRILFSDARFRDVSTDAKLLYGLMLDRIGLSQKHGWLDEENRVYIYFTMEDIMNQLGCSHGKAFKLLAELDTNKGVDLIHRVKQGQGRPTKIYVMKAAGQSEPVPKNGSQDFSKTAVQTSEKRQSVQPESGIPDFSKSDSSYIELNKTNLNYTDPSNQSITQLPDKTGYDGMGYEEAKKLVKGNVEYDFLVSDPKFNRQRLDEVVELITEVLCSHKQTVVVAGDEYPAQMVRDRLLKIDSMHIEYVFDCLDQNTTYVRNIKKYMLAALFNAPSTIDSYYTALVHHDQYGDGLRGK